MQGKKREQWLTLRLKSASGVILTLSLLSCKIKDFDQNSAFLSADEADRAARLSNFKKSVSDLADKTAQFWLTRGIDPKGGFYGAIDVKGNPNLEAPKQLSQQARHLWFLSAYARLKNSLEAKKEAQNLFQFIYKNFRKNRGEYALYLEKNGEKAASSGRKLWMYMHSFVIFSFAEYHRLSGENLPLDEALGVLKTLPYDSKNGGYDQQREERWYEGVKETNSHMHAMEAFMNLYDVLPTSRGEDRKFVLNRFRELYGIFMTKITLKGFAYHDSFDAQWNPAGKGWINFGHDFEIVHLLLKARKILGDSDPKSLEHIINLGRLAIKNGYDQQSGGSFYKGQTDGTVSDPTKIWWAQCEQLLALYRLHEVAPDLATLEHMEKTFKWIQDHHLSRDIKGAWFATADNQGTKEWSSDLSSEWFASYHTMRALLEIGSL